MQTVWFTTDIHVEILIFAYLWAGYVIINETVRVKTYSKPIQSA